MNQLYEIIKPVNIEKELEDRGNWFDRMANNHMWLTIITVCGGYLAALGSVIFWCLA